MNIISFFRLKFKYHSQQIHDFFKSFLEIANEQKGCDDLNENNMANISYSVEKILKIGEMHKLMLLEKNLRVGVSNKQKEKTNRQKRYQRAKKVSIQKMVSSNYSIL